MPLPSVLKGLSGVKAVCVCTFCGNAMLLCADRCLMTLASWENQAEHCLCSAG